MCVCDRERGKMLIPEITSFTFVQHGTLKMTSVPLHRTDRQRSSKQRFGTIVFLKLFQPELDGASAVKRLIDRVTLLMQLICRRKKKKCRFY